MPAEKFKFIFKDLKSRVESGKYPAGSLLPSEHQLTVIYHCSRNTVRRAISMLSEMGYVQPIHGLGVQIIYHPIRQANYIPGGIESFAETVKRNHLKARTKVVRFTEMTVDEHIHNHTGFPVGSEVYYIQRVRFLDRKPVILDINVFLKSQTPGLTKAIAARSIYQYLEKDLGMQITTRTRCFTAERATEIDTRFLDLLDYDFVAAVTSQTYNSNGVMFEWTQSRHRPDYFVFYDTVKRAK